eukprot:UN26037
MRLNELYHKVLNSIRINKLPDFQNLCFYVPLLFSSILIFSNGGFAAVVYKNP